MKRSRKNMTKSSTKLELNKGYQTCLLLRSYHSFYGKFNGNYTQSFDVSKLKDFQKSLIFCSRYLSMCCAYQYYLFQNDVVRVKQLLAKTANPNVRDNAGWTPLVSSHNSNLSSYAFKVVVSITVVASISYIVCFAYVKII